MDLKDKIRSIENYPQEGVIFRDITTLLKDAEGMKQAIDEMQKKLEGVEFDVILGPESRGLPERYVTSQTALTIPMKEGQRSLNLSNSVAIVAYEHIRQLGL